MYLAGIRWPAHDYSQAFPLEHERHLVLRIIGALCCGHARIRVLAALCTKLICCIGFNKRKGLNIEIFVGVNTDLRCVKCREHIYEALLKLRCLQIANACEQAGRAVRAETSPSVKQFSTCRS